MRALDRKLLRDVRHLKGQLTAIGVLVACGIATFIMLRSMNGYLREGQAGYYAEYGFGDVFAHVERAPDAIAARIGHLSGVASAYTRLVHDVLLDVPGLAEPATGRLVSLPDGQPPLHRLHLRAGRLPQSGRGDEVAVSAAFAEANQLRIGDSFGAVINGQWRRLRIVGTAISPEFIYEISGWGQVFPDNRRFGALWMSRRAMAAAFGMEGAFDDVVVKLQPGASEAAVVADLDRLLGPYGGPGAYGRDLHVSHEFVSSEIEETRITATFFPALFLGVTAFLLHTTLLRLVRMEREAIGLMKAFGYRGRTLALHYVGLAGVPLMAGSVVGTALGVWLASSMAGVYAEFYQFPDVAYRADARVVLSGFAIVLVTGVVGALAAAHTVVRLPPAVAMRPPAPPRYRRGLLERTALWRLLGPPARIVVRTIARARWKSAATAGGIALALGVMASLFSMFDAIDFIEDLQFRRIQREHIAVFLDRPAPRAALSELLHVPGVLSAEAFRSAPVRLRHGHREQRLSLLGLEPDGGMRRIVDADLRVHEPPVEGIALGRRVAERLGVTIGDVVRAEITEGRRIEHELAVHGIVDELMGGEAYMDAAALGRLLREEPTISGAWLRIDPLRRDEVYARLRRLPAVGGVLVHEVTLRGFRETLAESFLIALGSTVFLGGALVIAIVYNAARIALSERGRDLASLRVLGFHRREVARILLGEQAALVLAALPAGAALGWFFTWLITSRFESELFRMPAIARVDTYLGTIGIVLGAAIASALLVRRRLDRSDLIAVLKTRE